MMDDLNNNNVNNNDTDNTTEMNNNNNDNTVNMNMPIEYKKESNKNRKPFNKKIASYIAVGLTCAILGGGISTASALYLLPKSNFFKSTPLYKTMANGGSSSLGYINASPTSTKTSSATGSGLTVSQIVKKVSPAVVGVSTKTTVTQNDFDSFFGSSNGNGSSTQEGMGSGIIFNNDGYILTNYHVIKGADKIAVILNNKKEVSAKVVNYDEANDIAVIKMTGSFTVPGVAELGSSASLNVGDSVVAIGNPLGKEFLGTVTTGVVSAVNREVAVSEGQKQTYIQTDAAINPGNSGGPLVNSFGQVVGINSAKISENGVEGIGFSIPIDTVKSKIQNLSKPILMLGISGEAVDKSTAEQHNIPQGVYIEQIQDFSSAQKAGMQVGDVITKFDGKKVTSTSDIDSIKSKHNSGDTVQVEVYRDDAYKTLSLKLSDK
ncbi:serine protease Do [Clostridium acetobutylicum]|uniref:HtrA-like serine protease (With PDZ domain) n=1 Tax=Clostridium acetobutylicum (strain ATCC 824 / DSM 792 / JCM 1419 / IAM 19013 / LMG 5710 / NBRC 13948 / NRRL B-527 / VKM B-1787 / 2291 / W) TaxID=272562 RepID=Q97GD5_CLOAB|nr:MULTISPECIES: trypsin-like peptidase domain-containing protein [Clostridium]AAK80387.1 HtrA-like serine protease (with PDZ domain) [Clostridium acetobutylicum ATCC 824]ADZ21484.1 HtrA-like serine protease (with PDZ domain) [Clostridium acetobutylicum EA 2018]AEI34068.1 HtrA-like serine protease [Clostridium acetobutylicum DSM 1731]AWV79194.1 PDZ domain-containing protein [Clostridium acetobutylicum]MBC2394841.1 trypsin-like serine protease [Clostridium acetobutylicum]